MRKKSKNKKLWTVWDVHKWYFRKIPDVSLPWLVLISIFFKDRSCAWFFQLTLSTSKSTVIIAIIEHRLLKIAWNISILKKKGCLFLKYNWTECPILLFAKSSKPICDSFFVLLHWILKITLQRVRYGNVYPERLTSKSHDWKMVIWGLTFTYVSSIVYGHSIYSQDLQIKTSLTSSNNERIWLLINCPNQRVGITWKLQRVQNLFPEQRLKHVIFLMSSRPLKETRKQRSVLSWQSLKQWFSTRGDFVHRGTFGNVWIRSWLSQLGVLLKSSG